jgi:acetyl-CoA synthetase
MDSLPGFAARLEAHLRQGGDDVAMVHYSPDAGEVASVSWSHLHERIEACATDLNGNGVSAGELVCIIGPSGVELVTCFLACIQLGAIASIFPPPSPLQARNYYVEQQTRALAVADPLTSSSSARRRASPRPSARPSSPFM